MALPPPPAGLDLGDDRGPEITRISIATFVLATVAIILRLYARYFKGNSLCLGLRPLSSSHHESFADLDILQYLDDWLLIVAWGAGVGLFSTTLGYVVPHGTGRHVWAGPPDALKAWALGLFISEICYTAALATREGEYPAPDPDPGRHRGGLGHRSLRAREGILAALNAFFNGNSIPNIITDACMVTLPLPYIWKLQLQRAQKIALGGVFAVGAFVTVVSIIRLRLIVHVDLESPDVTFNFVTTVIWTIIETNIAIVCACLPSLKPLLSLAVKWTTLMPGEAGSGKEPAERNIFINTFMRRGKPAKKSRSDTLDDERPFAQLNEAEAQATSGSGLELRDIGTREGREERDGITVTTQLRMQQSGP
ncbi:uncharacterized protein PG986_008772 [Apiospora aurea]|uniref:Rhodopsin domain-containing protein n=1 Tax=Apiospora aurea TaxID=335848 RepID=A0ABR1Q5Q1_9PEZI